MSKARTDFLKSIMGCGVACAFTGAALGADAVLQWTLFAFGCTYGGLWISHEQE